MKPGQKRSPELGRNRGQSEREGSASVAENPKESKEHVPSWTEHIANPRPVEAWSVRRARKA